MNIIEQNALIKRFIDNGWFIKSNNFTKIIKGTKIINGIEFTLKISCQSEYSLYLGHIKIYGGDTSFERRIDFSTTDAYAVVYDFINAQEIKIKINELEKQIRLFSVKINTLENAIHELVESQKNTSKPKQKTKQKSNTSRIQQIYNYVNSNHSIEETAKHFGIKENTVSRYLYKYKEI